MQFTSATYRLKVGVPATVEHGGSHHQSVTETPTGVTDQVNARHIAETVEVTSLPFSSCVIPREVCRILGDLCSVSLLWEPLCRIQRLMVEIHYLYGRVEIELQIERSITSVTE